MPRGPAFNNDPWTSFSKDSDSLFTQNFVQDKLLVFKTTHRPSKGVIKFTQNVTAKNHQYQCNEEVRVWMPLGNNGASFLGRVTHLQAKLHYEHGLRDYSGNLLNFYGGVQVNKQVNNYVGKLGMDVVGANGNLDSRLRVSVNENGHRHISSGHKLNWVSGRWNFDLCQVFNYRPFSLFLTSARVIYKKQDKQVFVKAQNQQILNTKNIDLLNLIGFTLNTKLQIGYIRQINSTSRAGMKFDLNNSGKTTSSLIYQYNSKDKNLKIKSKVSLDKSISLSVQSPLQNYGKWVVGWHLDNIGTLNNSKFGVLLDLHL